jgi:hypothetical protein
MRSLFLLRRAAVAVAAVLALLFAGSAPAMASNQSVQVRFSAEHERGCWYMYTKGVLEFHQVYIGYPLVDVRGELAERRNQNAPCALNEQTWAEFTAYVTDVGASVEVDREIVYLHDPTDPSNSLVKQFEFPLVNASMPHLRIDRVDVTVCRDFGPWLPAFSCGETQTYRPYSFGPT